MPDEVKTGKTEMKWEDKRFLAWVDFDIEKVNEMLRKREALLEALTDFEYALHEVPSLKISAADINTTAESETNSGVK